MFYDLFDTITELFCCLFFLNLGLGFTSTPRPTFTYSQTTEKYYNAPNPTQDEHTSSSLSFDPGTKTLFIDSSSAQMLNLQDGDTIPLPDHILQEVCIQCHLSFIRIRNSIK